MISEETRHRMYQRLEELLGLETATAVMEHLPPVGWADVATRRDLDALEQRLEHRIDALDHRVDAVKFELLGEIHKSSRNTVLAMTFANTALVGIVLGVAQLG